MAETKAKAPDNKNENIDMQKLLFELAELKKKVEQQEAAKPEQQTLSEEIEAIKRGNQYMNELVEIQLFKDNERYKEPLYVAVNGKAWLIQRGVPVKVPRYVAEVIDSADRQTTFAANYSEEQENKFENESRRLGYL